MSVTDKQMLEWFRKHFYWMQGKVHGNAVDKGFHTHGDNPLFVPTHLALIMSEAAEALDAHRKGEDSHLGEELADIVIRTMDLADALGIELGREIVDKHLKNTARPKMHGGKRY
jgi:NTP pyrophosphatase (non-canonical NTP hydrolase)